MIIGTSGILILRIASFILQISVNDWSKNELVVSIIASICVIEFALYGSSMCNICIMYPAEILPERGFAIIMGVYWLTMSIIILGFSNISTYYEEHLPTIFTGYLGGFIVIIGLVINYTYIGIIILMESNDKNQRHRSAKDG